MDILERKRLMRRTILATRGRLTSHQRIAAATTAAAAALNLREVTSASTVLAFASFGTEIPTDPLVEALLASGRTVLVPRVEGTRLRAVAISSLDELAPGFRGIREPPAPGPAIDPTSDVVVVPGVAFDARGRRLGYGGGFYDAFLAAAGGFRAGYCFECQIVEEVPAGPGDMPVDAVVTEARVLRAHMEAPGGT